MEVETEVGTEVIGAVLSGHYSNHWWGRVTFTCPCCHHKHVMKVEGPGDLPMRFLASCRRTHEPVFVIPYQH